MAVRQQFAELRRYLGQLGITAATTLTASGASTLTGAVSCLSTLAAAGNFAINTDKFTVAAASGNTAVAGTLAVTGATTAAAIAATTVTASGDIDAAGGFHISMGPFVQDNVAANQSAVVVKLGATGATVVDGVAPRAGSLVGIVASFTVAPAGTDLVVSVLKNGTLIHSTGILTVTAGATLGRAVTFTKDNANLLLAAGDRIGVTVTTGAGWTATTSDMAVFVIVEG